MAVLELCDGSCGRESPDKKGLWEGNHWLEVTIRDRRRPSTYRDTNEHYLVCKECAKKKTIDEIRNSKPSDKIVETLNKISEDAECALGSLEAGDKAILKGCIERIIKVCKSIKW